MAEEEDNKMAEQMAKGCQWDCVFLVLLSIPLPHRRLDYYRLAYSLPQSRDWSRCPSRILGQIHKTPSYLKNMYQLFADPDISTLVKSRPLSPPKHAIWVNSLWFLSQVISLTVHVPYWQHRYSCGHIDMSQSLNQHGVARRSEPGSVRYLLMAWKGFIYPGRLKRCPLCYSLCSGFSPGFSFLCLTLITQSSILQGA
jgi:hypothetical protein